MTSCFPESQEKLFLFRTWALANELESCDLMWVARCQRTEAAESCREVEMKLLLALACFLFAMSSLAYSAAAPQTFPTSAGEVKITPLYHASTLIEAGGKTIYVDPAKPAKLTGLPKADLILISHIHPDHMDPASIKEVSKADTKILAPAAVVQTVTSAKPIANGETKSWQGWTIEAMPAYNLKRGPAA